MAENGEVRSAALDNLDDIVAELNKADGMRDDLTRQTAGFAIQATIEQRNTTDPWFTLELGPGNKPSGLNRRYEGDSVYVAIEPHITKGFSSATDTVFEQIRKGDRSEEKIFVLGDEATGRLHEPGIPREAA